MKKIKVFLSIIFSIMCLFSLFGCSASDGYYVQDSLVSQVSYYSSLKKASASVEFSVYLPSAAKYEISYTLQMYYKGNKIDEETFFETRDSLGAQTKEIYESWSVYYSASNAYAVDFDVRVVDVTAKIESSSSTTYRGLAIGFGVAGGAIMIGIVALYILLNKRSAKD